MFNDEFVSAVNVINNNSGIGTISDINGDFTITVKVDDELIFSSIQYKIKSVKIKIENILDKELLVKLDRKVNFLEEVVVSPEDKRKFLELKNEEFKRYVYERDKSSKLDNEIMNRGKLQDGLNFSNVYKLLTKNLKNEEKNEIDKLFSNILPKIFENEFFIYELGINNNEIIDFLNFLDTEDFDKNILERESKFYLIDFLIEKSNNYKSIKN